MTTKSLGDRGFKRCPCTIGQSLWYTSCPVNFSFFGSTKFFFGYTIFFFCIPKFFFVNQISFWYTKLFFGLPNLSPLFFGRPKNEKLAGQLVYQRDWPKVHGRHFRWLHLFVCILMFSSQKQTFCKVTKLFQIAGLYLYYIYFWQSFSKIFLRGKHRL